MSRVPQCPPPSSSAGSVRLRGVGLKRGGDVAGAVVRPQECVGATDVRRREFAMSQPFNPSDPPGAGRGPLFGGHRQQPFEQTQYNPPHQANWHALQATPPGPVWEEVASPAVPSVGYEMQSHLSQSPVTGPMSVLAQGQGAAPQASPADPSSVPGRYPSPADPRRLSEPQPKSPANQPSNQLYREAQKKILGESPPAKETQRDERERSSSESTLNRLARTRQEQEGGVSKVSWKEFKKQPWAREQQARDSRTSPRTVERLLAPKRDDVLAVEVTRMIGELFRYLETPREGPFFLCEATMQLVPMDRTRVLSFIKRLFLRQIGLEVKDRLILHAIEVFREERRQISDQRGKILLRVGVEREGHRWIMSGDHFKVLYQGGESFQRLRVPRIPYLAGDYQEPLPELTRDLDGGLFDGERFSARTKRGIQRRTDVDSTPSDKSLEVRGRISEVLALAGIPQERDLMVYAWMVQALMPETGLQALLLSGDVPAVSSAQRVLRDLLDPSRVPLVEWPRRADEIPRRALEHYLLVWEYAEKIPRAQQRRIAELLIGTSVSWSGKERRYNPRVDVKNPVILGGDEGTVSEDELAARTVVIELLRSPADSGTDTGEDVSYPERLNRAFSGMMALLAYVHARLPGYERPSVAAERRDYGAIGELVAEALGRGRDAFWRQYEGWELERAVRESESRPVIEALIHWLAAHMDQHEQGAWVDQTIKQWLAELEGYRPGWSQRAGDWPQSPRMLGHDLEKALPILHAMGAEADKTRQCRRRGPNHRFWLRIPSREHVEQLQEYVS